MIDICMFKGGLKMAICKNCLHSDVCIMTSELGFNKAERMFDFDCKHFKDRNKFVELPCKVGDIVYQTDGIRIYENKINKIRLLYSN